MQALNLDSEEHIVHEVRKHWFVFFAHGFFVALAAIAPFVLYKTVVVFHAIGNHDVYRD